MREPSSLNRKDLWGGIVGKLVVFVRFVRIYRASGLLACCGGDGDPNKQFNLLGLILVVSVCVCKMVDLDM